MSIGNGIVRVEGRTFARQAVEAGRGNRTLVFSLEGYCSTIELHPRGIRAGFVMGPSLPGWGWLVRGCGWRGLDLGESGRRVWRADALGVWRVEWASGHGVEVGSAGFEPAKAEPLDLQSSPFDRSGNSPHVMVISVWDQTSSEPKTFPEAVLPPHSPDPVSNPGQPSRIGRI